MVKNLLNSTKLCLGHNVFQFKNKFYEQIEGTVMENPLSPFLAEILINRFGTKLKNTYVNFIKVLVRIVDHIFALVDI